MMVVEIATPHTEKCHLEKSQEHPSRESLLIWDLHQAGNPQKADSRGGKADTVLKYEEPTAGR